MNIAYVRKRKDLLILNGGFKFTLTKYGSFGNIRDAVESISFRILQDN